jgi:DNA polymerase
VILTFDFETYSEAGFAPKDGGGWERLAGAAKYGIAAVGAAAYAQHPSTEILSLAWARDDEAPQLWEPSQPPPRQFFQAIHDADEIEAWNASFEVWIWRYVAVPKLGWPKLPIQKVRCAMARARAYALPGALGEASRVVGLPPDLQKDPAGDRLLRLLSVPRQPTKGNPSLRLLPSQAPQEAAALYQYNARDVVAERATVSHAPPLPPAEVSWWKVEQACNRRGVRIDMALVRGAIRIITEVRTEACAELADLTGGAVRAPTEVQKIIGFLAAHGVYTASLDEESVERLLGSPSLPPVARRVLGIRAAVASASVNKYFAFARQVAAGDRIHDLFNYHGAHTGRETASDTQPQNLPNSGPQVCRCAACGRHHGTGMTTCPWCGTWASSSAAVEWCGEAAEDAIKIVSEGDRSLLLRYFGADVPVLAGCLRGVFCATPGHVMMGADYSAIEGVGAAMLTGEQWRIDVFRTHGKIYEMAGAKMLHVPLEEVLAHKERTGNHHPIRKVAKVGELAGGYGGGVGAWKAFGAEAYFDTEDAIRDAVYAWRNDSPMFPLTWYALHDTFVECLRRPGRASRVTRWTRNMECMGVVEGVELCFDPALDVLRLKLPSGRFLTYHRPRLEAEEYGRPGISYEGWNTNPKMGSYGWVRKRTFGGRLFENLVQAACRDILTYAAVQVYGAGYELALHVHDELCVEVPEDRYPILNEKVLVGLMTDTAPWAKHWPIRAAGAWAGRRFQK